MRGGLGGVEQAGDRSGKNWRLMSSLAKLRWLRLSGSWPGLVARRIGGGGLANRKLFIIFRLIAISAFGIIFFCAEYVRATMASIGDGYLAGIEDFKLPFYIISNIATIILMAIPILSLSVKTFRQKGFPLGRGLGLAAIIVALLVWILGSAPCKDEFDGHAEPRTLEKVIAHSLLCPEYSNRSYFGLVIPFFFGLLAYVAASLGRLTSSKIWDRVFGQTPRSTAPPPDEESS